jgi:hypothetical protein
MVDGTVYVISGLAALEVVGPLDLLIGLVDRGTK